MRVAARKYVAPGIAGALVSSLVRLIHGNAEVAAIGLVVFGVVYGTLILLGNAMNWQEAPVQHAVIATIAVTAAYLLTDARA